MSEERKTLKERVKAISPKRALYAFSILFMLGLIALMTFANWIIDPEHFSFYSWLTNTLILIGIQIPAIVLGELTCKDRQESAEGGRYKAALRRFRDSEEGIIRNEKGEETRRLKGMKETKQFFSQYFFRFRNEENFRKKVAYLMSKEIDGQVALRIVKYYDSDDLPQMERGVSVKKDAEGNEIKESKIGKLRPEQLGYVKEVFEGKVNIKENSYAYYLSADADKGAADSILEEGPRIEREEKRLINRNRAVKVLSHVFFSAVFAMLTVDTIANAGDMQTWVNLVSRLASMVAGLTSGWMTSVTVVKMEASVIEKKCIVREGYNLSIEDGSFKPKSYEEMVDEEQKAEEEERKKAAEAVITPEAVDGKFIGYAG